MAIDAGYVRKFASEAYVRAARERGEHQFSIAVRPVLTDLTKRGLPAGRTPLICSVLSGRKFQDENRIVLDRSDGPPSGQSPTMVYHFHFLDWPDVSKNVSRSETPEQWASRVTEKIRGLLKEEIEAHGGTEGYLKWVRSSDEQEDK